MQNALAVGEESAGTVSGFCRHTHGAAPCPGTGMTGVGASRVLSDSTAQHTLPPKQPLRTNPDIFPAHKNRWERAAAGSCPREPRASLRAGGALRTRLTRSSHMRSDRGRPGLSFRRSLCCGRLTATQGIFPTPGFAAPLLSGRTNKGAADCAVCVSRRGTWAGRVLDELALTPPIRVSSLPSPASPSEH